MSNYDIIGGLLVSFDIFEKNEIENVIQKISNALGIQPKEEKTHITSGVDSYEVYQNVWKTNISEFLASAHSIFKEKEFKINNELLKSYISSFEIRGYNSPKFPFYILLAKLVLNNDILSSSKDLRKDVFIVSRPVRIFIENLNGLTNKIVGYSPRASIVTQLWVKVDKQYLAKMRNIVLHQFSKSKRNADSKDFKTFDYLTGISKELKNLEPFDLAPSVGDVHSHIIDGENIYIILGHTMQTALGGLRTPYVIKLSYEESFFEVERLNSGFSFITLDFSDLNEIIFNSYILLITLISISTYLSYIAIKQLKIETDMSKLRNIISTTEYSNKDLRSHLNKLNNFGTQLSSLLNLLGTFSRQREKSIQQTSEGTSSLCFEVPIKTALSKFYPHQRNEGYLRTISNQILNILTNTKEALINQESEIRSLQTHLSNIVNLNYIKSNEALQKRMYIIAIIGIIIAFISGFSTYQSWRIDELQYQQFHPEGTYYVQVDFLGYDEPTNYDQFRISITYLGRGESQFIKLSIGIVGVNPIAVSIVNLDVMEPSIILGRKYIDGLVGWVDYNIQRAGNLTSKINIINYTSDVEVKLK